MVQFKKRSNVIPVDFETFSLQFVANDENYKLMQAVADKIKQDAEGINDLTDIEALDKLKGVLHEAWDGTFGAGTFDKVYAFAGESSISTMIYFLETVEGISDEYNSQMEHEKLAKYINQ
ncbi:hypothetical protein [Eremococcus coleocola]|uniref:hypothetical protein n=1 Tax=Eremococcus coleocola TaxID=88132 RepID=UPI00040F4B3A|nr:hypothetical protein [Eremococcus coleocola]